MGYLDSFVSKQKKKKGYKPVYNSLDEMSRYSSEYDQVLNTRHANAFGEPASEPPAPVESKPSSSGNSFLNTLSGLAGTAGKVAQGMVKQPGSPTLGVLGSLIGEPVGNFLIDNVAKPIVKKGADYFSDAIRHPGFVADYQKARTSFLEQVEPLQQRIESETDPEKRAKWQAQLDKQVEEFQKAWDAPQHFSESYGDTIEQARGEGIKAGVQAFSAPLVGKNVAVGAVKGLGPEALKQLAILAGEGGIQGGLYGLGSALADKKEGMDAAGEIIKGAGTFGALNAGLPAAASFLGSLLKTKAPLTTAIMPKGDDAQNAALSLANKSTNALSTPPPSVNPHQVAQSIEEAGGSIDDIQKATENAIGQDSVNAFETAMQKGDYPAANMAMRSMADTDPYKQQAEELLGMFNHLDQSPSPFPLRSVAEKTDDLFESIPSPKPSQIGSEDLLPGPSQQKMRGFSESVTTNPNTPKQVSDAITDASDSYYTPLSNADVVAEANKIIAQGEDNALRIAKSGEGTNANATAMLLIDKYLKKGDYEKATSLIKDVSPRFTEQGRQVQILSLYGRQTPTGAVKLAQHVIDQANSKLPPDKQIKLSSEIAGEIADMAKKIQDMADGREKTVAIAKMMDKIAAQVPASIGQKLATLQTMAQLLNPKTAIRNIIGNAGFAVAENVSDVVATPIDALVSLVTGKRTKTLPSISKQVSGFTKGFKLGLEDALEGIDTSGGVASQYDLPSRTFREGILGKLEKAMNVELRATDRAFYNAAFEGSLDNQMRAAGVTQPTQKMLELAHADGLYRTFQDDTVFSKFLSKIKKLFNELSATVTGTDKFGLGDINLKYPKTPGNVVARGIDYSPLNIGRTIFQDIAKPLIGKSPFEQKRFVENLSRGLVGSTSIFGVGYVLGKLGIITGKPEKDFEIAATQRAVGEGGYKLNVSALKRFALSAFNPEVAKPQEDDLLVSYDWFQPLAIDLSMGVNVAQGGKGEDLLPLLQTSLDSGIESLTGQPIFKGPSTFLKEAQDRGIGSALGSALSSVPAGFTPSILNQVGQLTDNTSRETYDPNPLKESTNKVLARIPGLRQTLPERKDVFGQSQETFQDGGNTLLNVLVNPAFVSRLRDKPEAKEVLNIFKETGETKQAPRIVPKKVKINGENVQLTSDQYIQYQEYVGRKTREKFAALAKNPAFLKLSTEKKANEMSSILSDINKEAKIKLFGEKQK